MLVSRSCPSLCDPVDWMCGRQAPLSVEPGKNSGVGSHSLLQGWNLVVIYGFTSFCLTVPPLCTLLFLSPPLDKVTLICPSSLAPRQVPLLCCSFFMPSAFMSLLLVVFSFSTSNPSYHLLYSYSRMLLCHDHSLSTIIHLFRCAAAVRGMYVTLEKLPNFCKGQLLPPL